MGAVLITALSLVISFVGAALNITSIYAIYGPTGILNTSNFSTVTGATGNGKRGGTQAQQALVDLMVLQQAQAQLDLPESLDQLDLWVHSLATQASPLLKLVQQVI